MPSNREHSEHTLKILGEAASDLHSWMDELRARIAMTNDEIPIMNHILSRAQVGYYSDALPSLSEKYYQSRARVIKQVFPNLLLIPYKR
jgi:hypothetical protein